MRIAVRELYRVPEASMIPIDTALKFLVAAIVIALAPGPDNIFVLMQSALYGRLAGLCVVLGLCTGLIVHTLAVALGAAALLETSSAAFSSLKICGSFYLLYLAFQAFRAGAMELRNGEFVRPSYGHLYVRGVIMNITNPKVTLFCLALLPQFADASLGNLTPQILTLGGLFIVATILVFGGIALLAGSLRLLFERAAVQLWLNRVAGAVFVALAASLAAAEV